MTLTQLFTNIANAIRAKTGSSETIKAENFPTEIANITTGTDTSDANAEPINIRKDKTAYVNGKKITGTLPVLTYPVNPDNPSDFDYQFIEASTAKKVTRSSTDYIMGAYQIAGNNEPDSWMFEGNRKMKLGIAQSKVATAISLNANQIKKGEKILGVTGTYEGEGKSFPPDWTEIGYEDTPQGIIDGFNYAKEIKDNWNSSSVTLSNKFAGNTNLMFMPLVDTSNALIMQGMFSNCTNLISISRFDTSKVTNMQSMFLKCDGLIKLDVSNFNTSNVTNMQLMFYQCSELINLDVSNFDINKVNNMSGMFDGCSKLSNDSLNSIMKMCINGTSYTGTKTLKNIGLTQAQAETCQTLSNWNDFVSAGWTSGY